MGMRKMPLIKKITYPHFLFGKNILSIFTISTKTPNRPPPFNPSKIYSTVLLLSGLTLAMYTIPPSYE
jgi:hypothetical protein